MKEFLYDDVFARNRLLWGEEAQQRLKQSRVALAGLGGVGSYVAETLARAGIGSLMLVDHDRVELSNINRQLPAMLSNLGQLKVKVVAERIAAINPGCRLQLLAEYIGAENAALLGEADYFIDAIDYLPGKIAIIEHALFLHKPVASAMGAALRLAPECLRLADISFTTGCPLARDLRKQLRARGIESGVTVVYSTEQPRRNSLPQALPKQGEKMPLGSSPFVPAVAGLLLASAVIRDLAKL